MFLPRRRRGRGTAKRWRGPTRAGGGGGGGAPPPPPPPPRPAAHPAGARHARVAPSGAARHLPHASPGGGKPCAGREQSARLFRAMPSDPRNKKPVTFWAPAKRIQINKLSSTFDQELQVQIRVATKPRRRDSSSSALCRLKDRFPRTTSALLPPRGERGILSHNCSMIVRDQS
jgi:hypothetical protein